MDRNFVAMRNMKCNFFRLFHSFFNKLQHAENSRAIFNISGCLKPCSSNEYKQVDCFQISIHFSKNRCCR